MMAECDQRFMPRERVEIDGVNECAVQVEDSSFRQVNSSVMVSVSSSAVSAWRPSPVKSRRLINRPEGCRTALAEHVPGFFNGG
jgi:hypothetical protein